MDFDLKIIGERLQKIRKHLNLLQKDFAKELGISASSLCDIEAGNMKPRFELIYALTKKFNVNILYLLHGTGDMFMREKQDTFHKSEIMERDREWWENFIYYIENSPMTRYAVMSYFLTYKNTNEELIKIDIENTRKKGKKEGEQE